ncbi:AcrR family transcriptional regulator [Actinoalloteichus hoggarensis]|uniref:HTH-type transcriptional repressor Bm3R1 n=1 Tax=Actinoalloteichus hoggarensis TaxID=1470176 RepID=A0A221WAX4_9PSEU|nr:TetR/AcrR family transcriptional regulator [Actinoalloteichus hoggarensis]ASO22659.1 HTH-type transcriptional repressor Bm3R1 [Actinoalloteichus hoggarensis]MBB5924199.1 AcrR family transcriptional regulator [Actinoalloteichus hoggarensis]
MARRPSRSDPVPVTITTPGQPTERADAVRNRARALEAASLLFAARGVAGVTMDDIAAEAGLGKGTLYRRFGDKGGLANALLDEREREFQERMLSGPPPLGPGADPAERLAAFAEAYLHLVLDNIDLLEMSETNASGARFRTGAYALWFSHCRILLEDAGAPDPELRADVLLAALSAEQVRHWSEDQERDRHDIAHGLAALAQSLTRGDRSSPRPRR